MADAPALDDISLDIGVVYRLQHNGVDVEPDDAPEYFTVCAMCDSGINKLGPCGDCGHELVRVRNAVESRPMRGIEEAIDSACQRAEETMARLDAVAEESRKVAANLNVILDRLVRILPQQRPLGDVWVDRNSLETGGDDGQ